MQGENIFYSMRWNLNGLSIEGITNAKEARDRWQAAFSPLPESTTIPDIQLKLDVVDTLPETPAGEVISSPDDSLTYYSENNQIVAFLPHYGQLRFDLVRGTTDGHIVPTALQTYGVFEDIIVAGLSPHLRRRGFFILDGFAAARDNYAVLLFGNDSLVKTAVGIALLDDGWQLLSLASPLLTDEGDVLRFPGLLSVRPEMHARFNGLSDIVDRVEGDALPEHVVAPESIWPNVWTERASIRSFFFLRFEERDRPAVTTMRSSETLRRLVPHAIEQWDRDMVSQHLRLLRRVVDRAPSYKLRLGPDVSSISALLASAL